MLRSGSPTSAQHLWVVAVAVVVVVFRRARYMYGRRLVGDQAIRRAFFEKRPSAFVSDCRMWDLDKHVRGKAMIDSQDSTLNGRLGIVSLLYRGAGPTDVPIVA
ncbi:hypothetical protein CMEL01_01403 [Colletotrichum melonis]|uniref:Uncharacterized protein n=1 Tax=Colletotrichum melonis TaxID=1209925 RepID=A0AAI9V2Z1_9PEZI|nr:hypothetical protein CMEL01_01403 [Colletotrichum melonis]